MKPNYNGLWHMLIDRKMSKRDLLKLVGISSATLSKMTHEEWIALEVAGRICKALDCNIGDIISFDYEEDNSNE